MHICQNTLSCITKFVYFTVYKLNQKKKKEKAGEKEPKRERKAKSFCPRDWKLKKQVWKSFGSLPLMISWTVMPLLSIFPN